MTDRHSRYLRSLFIYICISSPFLVEAIEKVEVSVIDSPQPGPPD